MLPYFPILAALVLALIAEYEHRLDPFLLSCVTIIVAAVLLRQFLALSDNVDLVKSLATREDQLRHQADHDALTGLANRGCLLRMLDAPARIVRRRGVSACSSSTSTTSSSSTTSTGTPVATPCFARSQACSPHSVRKGDLAARLGGDEFAILLTGVSGESQASDVAERILNEMAMPLAELNGNKVDVSASIGIAASNRGEIAQW